MINWNKSFRFWQGAGLLYLTQVLICATIQLWLFHRLDWPICRAFLGGSVAEWCVFLSLLYTLVNYDGEGWLV